MSDGSNFERDVYCYEMPCMCSGSNVSMLVFSVFCSCFSFVLYASPSKCAQNIPNYVGHLYLIAQVPSKPCCLTITVFEMKDKIVQN